MPYHFAIDKDRKIYEGRPINIKGSHVENGNTGNIGIVLMADLDTQEAGLSLVKRYVEKFMGDGEATDPMIESLFQLSRYLKSEYGIKYLGGHQEFLPARPCPGNIGMEWVEKIRQTLKMQKPTEIKLK
ncbi:peptidoglycan recognition family protein [Pedobacter sp. Bi27]|uniref:peptidoglycan recognition protein family protein n=1 Tax=Pedobacter sp. Bi27 TaxID=2822351 RepID=UPI00353020E0